MVPSRNKAATQTQEWLRQSVGEEGALRPRFPQRRNALALKLVRSDQVRVSHQLAKRADELLGHVEATVVAENGVTHCRRARMREGG